MRLKAAVEDSQDTPPVHQARPGRFTPTQQRSATARSSCMLAGLALLLASCALDDALATPAKWQVRAFDESSGFDIDRGEAGEAGPFDSVTFKERLLTHRIGLEIQVDTPVLPVRARISTIRMEDDSNTSIQSDVGQSFEIGVAPRLAHFSQWELGTDAFAGYMGARVRPQGAIAGLPIDSQVDCFEAGLSLNLRYVPQPTSILALSPYASAGLRYGDGVQQYSDESSSELDYSAYYMTVGLEASWQSENGHALGLEAAATFGQIEGIYLGAVARF